MTYLISLLIGYIIGSFPTAYIILRSARNLDITKEGSGNVGAMNSFEVSKSKWIGIAVFIIDFIKGMLPVFILHLFSLNDFALLSIALTACIYAHCYNPWLKLKGGRGLATAAGGTSLIFPFLLIVWVVLWVVFYLMKKDITLANVAASIMSLILTLSSISTAMKYAFPKPQSEVILVLSTISIFLIIVSKHTEPIQELFESSKQTKRKKNNDIR